MVSEKRFRGVFSRFVCQVFPYAREDVHQDTIKVGSTIYLFP